VTTKSSAQELRQRFGVAAAGATHLAVAPSPEQFAEVGVSRRRVAGPARFTVELPRDQHRFIKQFALSADSDASTVTRILFRQLESDPDLAERIRSLLQP